MGRLVSTSQRMYESAIGFPMKATRWMVTFEPLNTNCRHKGTIHEQGNQIEEGHTSYTQNLKLHCIRCTQGNNFGIQSFRIWNPSEKQQRGAHKCRQRFLIGEPTNDLGLASPIDHCLPPLAKYDWDTRKILLWNVDVVLNSHTCPHTHIRAAPAMLCLEWHRLDIPHFNPYTVLCEHLLRARVHMSRHVNNLERWLGSAAVFVWIWFWK